MVDSTEVMLRRVLVIDDNLSIFDDFKSILQAPDNLSALDALNAELFEEEPPPSPSSGSYEVDYASQGQDGYEKVKQAVECGHPYHLAFVDMRMPPGWDGLETIEAIWQVDPHLQIVICSAFSDYRWKEIQERLGETDSLLILKKPFDVAEVAQLASALTEKWHIGRMARLKMEEMDYQVVVRTHELEALNQQLTLATSEAWEMARQAELANVAKSTFLANMSHELRTPLHGILGFAALGSKRAASSERDQLSTYFAKITYNGEILMTLLNDLLDLAKLESGKMTFDIQPHNIGRLCLTVAGEFQPLLAERSISLCHMIPSTPQVVAIDAPRMSQVMRNLLSNAIKFSPSGSTIELGLNGDEEMLRFWVRDSGVGIPPGELELIFDKFSQSSSTQTGAGGTGLGLAISRQIVAAHHGRIWAENDLEGGAVFTIELPLSMSTLPSESRSV